MCRIFINAKQYCYEQLHPKANLWEMELEVKKLLWLTTPLHKNTWRPILPLIFQTTNTQTSCHVSNPQQQQQRRQLNPEKNNK